jgi:hypothetical protein
MQWNLARVALIALAVPSAPNCCATARLTASPPSTAGDGSIATATLLRLPLSSSDEARRDETSPTTLALRWLHISKGDQSFATSLYYWFRCHILGTLACPAAAYPRRTAAAAEEEGAAASLNRALSERACGGCLRDPVERDRQKQKLKQLKQRYNRKREKQKREGGMEFDDKTVPWAVHDDNKTEAAEVNITRL